MPITAPLAADILLAFEALPEFCATLAASLRQAARNTTIAIHRGADAIAAATPAWRAVEYAGGAATPFQTLALGAAAAEVHLRRGETPRIVVVHEAGRPVVVLPTVVGRWAGVSTILFLGDPFIQYGDALVSPEAQPRHLEAAWSAAADPSAARAIYLRKVRADARLAPLLAREACVVAECAAPFIDLTVERRSSRDTRRSARRLAQEGDIALAFLPGACGASVREALELKRAWVASQALTSSVIGNDDWEGVLLGLAARGRGGPLAVCRLTVGGALAATEIGFVHRGVWYSYLGAISPDFARMGPGKVQIAEASAECRARGLATYDLLAPAQPYKQAAATGAVAVRDYVRPLDPLGRVALVAARSAPEIKTHVARLPPALRRLVHGLARL